MVDSKNFRERLQAWQGDITTLEADAIVNAANKRLLGGGGVDGAIHRAAGPELLAECRRIGGCPTGQARITRGYNLPCRYVIHTVGPVYSRSNPEVSRLLADCYRSSLRLAAEYELTSIAFPAISCGVYGYPLEEACPIAIETVCQELRDKPGIQKVIFALFSGADYRFYRQALSDPDGLSADSVNKSG